MLPTRKAIVLPICGKQKFLADLKREGYTCETLNLPKRIQGLAFCQRRWQSCSTGESSSTTRAVGRFSLDFGNLLPSKRNTTVT